MSTTKKPLINGYLVMPELKTIATMAAALKLNVGAHDKEAILGHWINWIKKLRTSNFLKFFCPILVRLILWHKIIATHVFKSSRKDYFEDPQLPNNELPQLSLKKTSERAKFNQSVKPLKQLQRQIFTLDNPLCKISFRPWRSKCNSHQGTFCTRSTWDRQRATPSSGPP